MKYLVLFIVLVLVYQFWRAGRRAEDAQARRERDATRPPAPQEMVRCAHCGVHLPRTDALTGPSGRVYCCQEHRLQAGG